MKNILLAIGIVMMMGFAADAQDSFFKWNDVDNEVYRDITNGSGGSFILPVYHGSETDESAPLGSGLLILTALGAGYTVYRKKNNKNN